MYVQKIFTGITHSRTYQAMCALNVLIWLTKFDNSWYHSKFDVQKKFLSKKDSDTWSSHQTIKKGTKQPCMIQAYVRSQKKSLELSSCVCSKDFHRFSTFENTSSNIYLNVMVHYSTTWPMLDAPSPHTKWLPTIDIALSWKCHKHNQGNTYGECKILGWSG